MNELWRTFGMTLCGMKGAAPRNNKMAALDWPGMSEALLKRMRQYEALIRDGEKSKDFWDAVILTAGTEEQRNMYQAQVEAKLKRKELPSCCKFFVFSDPPGNKVGDGGATLHALDLLVNAESRDYVRKSKVLLIHAGGYSQRLPSASVMGKIFMAYPINGEVYQMFELLLIMLVDFPSRMRPGVYVGCSDLLLPCILSGEWSFSEPGFTGIAIPSSAKFGTTHGVYVLEDPAAVKKQYEQEVGKTAFMSKFRKFVHKVSLEELQRQGAILPGTDRLYIDHSYFIDCDIVDKLLEFYKRIKPLKCEVDAYGDFLRPLGCDASLENIIQLSLKSPQVLADVRKDLFHVLHQEPARVVVMQQASFVHFGTIKEYLDHFCGSAFMKEACLFCDEALVVRVDSTDGGEDDVPPSKMAKTTSIPSSVVMASILDNRSSVAVGSVVEFSKLTGSARVETSCIVSGVHLADGLVVPSHSYLHTVAMETDNTVKYATFALGVDDNVKAKCSFENAHTLNYYGASIEKAIQKLKLEGTEDVWQKDTSECSLWNARLFALCDSRSESAKVSVEMLHILRHSDENSSAVENYKGRTRVSLQEMRRRSSLAVSLAYVDKMFTTCREQH